MATTDDLIRKQIQENPVLLYMKGSPDAPLCGFSGRAVAALRSLGASFAHVDVLDNPLIRERLPKVSSWPTFPQLFVAGELIGGSDIVMEMARSGELNELIERTRGASR